MKGTNRNAQRGMALGLCLGVSIGVAMGKLALGMCLGLAIGMGLGALKDREINRQTAEKGYRVKELRQQADGSFCLVAADTTGAQRELTVSAQRQSEQNFRVGDAIFIDGEGHAEQTLDKDEAEEDRK